MAKIFEVHEKAPTFGVHEKAPTFDWSNSSTWTFSSGWGAVTNVNIWSRRVGDSLEVNGVFQSGTQTSGTAFIQLPAGGSFTINSPAIGVGFVGGGGGAAGTSGNSTAQLGGSFGGV